MNVIRTMISAITWVVRHVPRFHVEPSRQTEHTIVYFDSSDHAMDQQRTMNEEGK